MKIKLYIILPLLLLLTAGQAQEEFFKPGVEWYYSSGYGLLQLRGHSLVKYTGDTIIDGYSLKRIDRTFYSFDLQDPTIPIDTFYSDPRYFMQIGDSILGYDEGFIKLHWIIGSDAGDVFVIHDEWEDYTMIVDSVQDVTIDGIDTKKMYIHGGVLMDIWGDTIFINQSGSEIIYAKFGPVSGFNYWSCWGFYDCGPGSLCRYVSDETGVVDISTGQQCETLLTSSSDIPKTSLNLYPNPCNDYVVIEQTNTYSNTRVEIFNQTGIEVLSVHIPYQKSVVDVSGLAAGIYFCLLRNEHGIEVMKFLKD